YFYPPSPTPEKPGRYYKSGYAPVVFDGEVSLVVGVDFPADFREAVERVDSRFTLLGAGSVALVLLVAVFVVRRRVQVPIYRLVRAMEGGDSVTEPGPPVRARVRWRDEIGVLTEHYNSMVDRLQAQEGELRVLASEARRKAEFMGGFSKYLVEGVPTAFVAIDPDGRVTVWNEAATKILGGSAAAVGQSVAKVLDLAHPVARALAAGLKGEVTDQAFVPLGPAGDAEAGDSDQDEGGARLVELDAGPFKNPATGELLGAAAFVHDRTELERLRRAAARNERLAAVGRLAAGLAHEIRNPLGAISGFAELIERKKGEDSQRLASRLRGEVDELNRFVTEFLAYARDQRIKRAPEDLTPLLKRATETALQAAGFTADEARRALEGEAVSHASGELRVAVDGDPELAQAAIDATALKAALVNIVKNAVEAMAGKGALALRAKRSGSIAVIRVRDSGPGVPVELRERIFDPFFTTRDSGVGLGLAIAHKIVVAHGGKVAVRAPDEGGCEFVIRIPIVPEVPGAGPPALDEDLTPSTPVEGVRAPGTSGKQASPTPRV
ncbi:PAS domain-containing protein, partial [bacterium]|nr:PAS domain-containing protein [bacterium]